MAMKENSKKVLNYLKAINGQNIDVIWAASSATVSSPPGWSVSELQTATPQATTVTALSSVGAPGRGRPLWQLPVSLCSLWSGALWPALLAVWPPSLARRRALPTIPQRIQRSPPAGSCGVPPSPVQAVFSSCTSSLRLPGGWVLSPQWLPSSWPQSLAALRANLTLPPQGLWVRSPS